MTNQTANRPTKETENMDHIHDKGTNRVEIPCTPSCQKVPSVQVNDKGG